MSDNDRRKFLGNSAKILLGASALGSAGAFAMQHGDHEQHASGNGLAIDASAKDTCATCQYWGGMRKLSADKSQVIAQSMGWCNNPDSMNHQKLTAADHQMRKTGIWKLWGAI